MNPNWIIGKKIAAVDMNPFDAGSTRHKQTAHSPRIHFTDGSSISFVTEETGGPEYGTAIVYSKPSTKRKK